MCCRAGPFQCLQLLLGRGDGYIKRRRWSGGRRAAFPTGRRSLLSLLLRFFGEQDGQFVFQRLFERAIGRREAVHQRQAQRFRFLTVAMHDPEPLELLQVIAPRHGADAAIERRKFEKVARCCWWGHHRFKRVFDHHGVTQTVGGRGKRCACAVRHSCCRRHRGASRHGIRTSQLPTFFVNGVIVDASLQEGA